MTTHPGASPLPVRLDPDATVVIEALDHGTTPRRSARCPHMARGGSRDGGGIGLALISRLCEHLQWRLEFSARAQRGTITTLRLRGAPVPPAAYPRATAARSG